MKAKKVLRAALLAGTLGATTFTAGCGSKEKETEQEHQVDKNIMTYDAYQHVISEPVDYDDKLIQIIGHEGYQPIGLSVRGYGGYMDKMSLLYTNCKEVVGLSNEFGSPVEPVAEMAEGVFDSYQHILLVLTDEDKNFDELVSYPYHNGYQLVGFDALIYGKYSGAPQASLLLYTNIEPVICVNYENQDGILRSTEFGTPIEKEKAYIKK